MNIEHNEIQSKNNFSYYLQTHSIIDLKTEGNVITFKHQRNSLDSAEHFQISHIEYVCNTIKTNIRKYVDVSDVECGYGPDHSFHCRVELRRLTMKESGGGR